MTGEYLTYCKFEDPANDGEQCGVDFTVEYSITGGCAGTRESPPESPDVEISSEPECPNGHAFDVDKMCDEVLEDAQNSMDYYGPEHDRC